MRTPAELTRLFRAHGRKVTPQRHCVFRALQSQDGHADDDADGHPTAERIYAIVRAEMETVSLKTVYQALHELVELGEVVALDVGTGAVRFDPNVERPHHHLVCRSCGKVRDLVVDLPAVELPVSLLHGYHVERREVVFRGLCGECGAVTPPGTAVTPVPVGVARSSMSASADLVPSADRLPSSTPST